MKECLDENSKLPREGCRTDFVSVRVASWNVAAINNNPFEYWITNPNSNYERLMKGIQKFMESPANDFPLNEIFTDHMFTELCAEMTKCSINCTVEFTRFWQQDFRDKMAISGFLKDKALGLKRLASMPDRITNTINLATGGTCMRPTVINAYNGGSLVSISSWWSEWKKFMFHTYVRISTGRDRSEPQLVCELLSPILRSKYPAITVEEQTVSVPLQILCLAILDAILVHMVNIVSPSSWEAVRRELCDALIQNKTQRVRRILSQEYNDIDVIFIQEAAAIFVEQVREDTDMHGRYSVLLPWNVDGKRDQNSMILVRRDRFVESSALDLTSTILSEMEGSWVAAGDLVVYSVADSHGRRWLLSSFHGDSNGLSTQPLMEALDHVARNRFGDHLLVVGLDANTYSSPPDVFHHSVESFGKFITDHGMRSSWGDVPDSSLYTTCSARTYLQTQFNKAVTYEKRLCQKSLKDWIVGFRSQVKEVSDVARDNTGSRKFVEGLVLPSLEFPSDHVILSTCISFQMPSNQAVTLSDSFACTVANSDSEILTTKALEEGQNSAAYEPSGRPTSRPGKRRPVATLYEYWGINDKPVTDVQFVGLAASLTNPSRISHETGLDEEIAGLCLEYYVNLATNPRGGFLDSRSLIFSKIEDSSIWILFSSRPVSMALSKTWGQLLFASMGLQYLVELLLNILAIAKVTNLEGRLFRLTSVLNHNSTVGIRSLGLLRDGCVHRYQSHVSSPSTSLAINFSDPVKFDGWFFETDICPITADSFLDGFRFETSMDALTWNEVRPPPWIQRNVDSGIVDLRPTWQWSLLWVVGMFGMVFGMLLPGVLGAQGYGRHATISVSLAVLMLASLAFVNGIYESVAASSATSNIAVFYWMMGLALTWLAQVFYLERYALQLIAPVFSLFGIATYLYKESHYPNLVSGVSHYVPLLWTTLPYAAAIILKIARYFVKRWVFGWLVKHERSLYDAVWQNIVRIDQNALKLLRSTTNGISARLGKTVVRQRHRSPQSVSWSKSCNQSSTAGSCEPEICSLDQLFNQAAALCPFLRHKTKQLALQSNGLFAVQSLGHEPRALHKWEDIRSSKVSSTIRWADLKPTDRALEKLLRSYNCEVSRLLDVCRQTIIFEHISDLTCCLEVMASDDEIEIVQLKNRMDEDYDASFSGGFRSDCTRESAE